MATKIGSALRVSILILIVIIGACSPKSTPSGRMAMPAMDSLQLEDLPQRDSVEYVLEEFLRYDDHVYQQSVRTVQFHKTGLPRTYPILSMGSSETLSLSFDDLDMEPRNLYYTIIHCDRFWKPSNIDQMDYLDGFMENEIVDYRRSFNTLQKFTHYRLQIPNNDVTPLLSGNYLLKVYEGDDDRLVLTRRFRISEDKVVIKADVRQPSLYDLTRTHQEVRFELETSGISVSNPFEQLYVEIWQNYRRDNAIRGIKPKYIQDNTLVYEFPQQLVFRAGKEFRRFDTRSFRHLTEQIAKHTSDILGQHTYLIPDEPRAFKRYFYLSDINGHYWTETRDGRDNDLEADYSWVHFFVPYDGPLTLGNVHIFGRLTGWQATEESMMTYNYDRKGYEGKLLLKQGFYNYQYAYVEDREEAFSFEPVEGDWFETENDYTILVYFRPFSDRYDHLVGIKTLNSLRD